MKKKILIGTITAALTLVIVSLLWWNGAFLPEWIQWNKREIPVENGTIELKKKTISYLSKNGNVLWSSPSSWKVSDVVISDFDQDGDQEVLMLCWRHGEYGAFHPIYESNDRIGWYEHFYVYDFKDNTLHHQWMSSKLSSLIQTISCENGVLTTISPYGETIHWKWQGRSVVRAD